MNGRNLSPTALHFAIPTASIHAVEQRPNAAIEKTFVFAQRVSISGILRSVDFYAFRTGYELVETKPKTRPSRVDDGCAGAEMRVITPFNSSITNQRTYGCADLKCP